ncbi:uncharacterized protein F5891DRAFT_1192682 [Suillus fuscotomentosus]|uniref:Uncharacterized protein n=1 Tax=Suillus fuscotomentosus TaxID=1912939 RepID=A0AAD4DZ53_9AGAM|nr:uncharacterized protein F5891DRAFT_1192682 [Suillus fuscotomentosus]KAG1896785.1 hypothetical protein F5891DRAFT_1192682 [Suillus fuscotomentosus]
MQIHPYAKAASGVLSVVSKASITPHDVSDARLTDIYFIQTITSQATRDDSIGQLLSNMDEVDMFLAENDLAALRSIKSVVVRICQQTLERSYFLRDYSKSQNFCPAEMPYQKLMSQ